MRYYEITVTKGEYTDRSIFVSEYLFTEDEVLEIKNAISRNPYIDLLSTLRQYDINAFMLLYGGEIEVDLT